MWKFALYFGKMSTFLSATLLQMEHFPTVCRLKVKPSPCVTVFVAWDSFFLMILFWKPVKTKRASFKILFQRKTQHVPVFLQIFVPVSFYFQAAVAVGQRSKSCAASAAVKYVCLQRSSPSYRGTVFGISPEAQVDPDISGFWSLITAAQHLSDDRVQVPCLCQSCSWDRFLSWIFVSCSVRKHWCWIEAVVSVWASRVQRCSESTFSLRRLCSETRLQILNPTFKPGLSGENVRFCFRPE